MVRLIAACAVTALSTFALTTGLWGHGLIAVAAGTDSSVAPPCPHAAYGANGNMGPLFCMIANPLALRYFAPIGRRTFALGPNAAPGEVSTALLYDFKHGGTLPIICSIYRLAAWRNQWRFGVSPIYQVAESLRLQSDWCQEPSFEQ